MAVVITDCNRSVAEIVPPRRDTNALFEREMREGWLSPPSIPTTEPPPRHPMVPFEELIGELERDRVELRGPCPVIGRGPVADPTGLGSRIASLPRSGALPRRAPSRPIDFIREQGDAVELASYDNRLLVTARALGIALARMKLALRYAR